MRSASIYYRVADFLRGFPPFSFVEEEDLLRLASSGRVKFHESDEYVFWQGRKTGRFAFVVQQGSVKLLDESGEDAVLHDLLGEGDIIGAETVAGETGYRYSAKTSSDVILYGLLAEELAELAKRYPKFGRYIESYLSVPLAEPSEQLARDDATGLGEARLPLDFLAGRTISCNSDVPVREALERWRQQGGDTLVVVDDGRPAGCLTCASLFELANGPTVEGRAGDLIKTPLRSLQAGLPPQIYALEMLNESCTALGLTDSRGELEAVLKESDLTLFGVPNLPQLGREIRRSRNLRELRELRRLSLRFGLQSLAAPADVGWVADAFTELNRLIVGRAIELTEGSCDWCAARCWVFIGPAARRELLTSSMPDVGLIHTDGDEQAARDLGKRVAAALLECGYHSPEAALTPDQKDLCQTLESWKDTFTGWITNPILTGLYAGLPFFEMSPVTGDASLVAALRQHIGEEVSRDEAFLPVLSNDSLANLPPLTFFQGLVVDDDGVRTARFDLRRSTLWPLADVGRYFAMECADLTEKSTTGRLEAAGAALSDKRELFEAAAAAFRVALYHQARTGLRDGTGGWMVEPTSLSRVEQQELKNGFRTTMNLLEFTNERSGIAP